MQEFFDLSISDWNERYLLGHYNNFSRGLKCPYCKAISSMEWGYGLGNEEQISDIPEMSIKFTIISAKCVACSHTSYWLKSDNHKMIEEQLLYPQTIQDSPTPNPDMPIDIKDIYNEASKVLHDSPRASAALSRLAIDKLTLKLTNSTKNLNARIGILVDKGLPVTIQKSLDIVRVVGNNAVHPGTLDLKDNKEMALSLLELVNLIVDNQISQPKKISKMFSELPQTALNAIKKRDNKS